MSRSGPALDPAVHEAVELQAYDPLWPARFEAEKRAIRTVLPTAFVDIEHIGSTAVPGLLGKPIIDLLGGVTSMQDTAAIEAALGRLGYVPSTAFPNTITDHLWFMRSAGGHRTHQLHVVVHGGTEWRRRIRFRDALRASPRLAEDYARLKRALARRHRLDRAAYSAGKTAFVHSVSGDA